jgi:putative heme-binding domain-containing protein
MMTPVMGRPLGILLLLGAGAAFAQAPDAAPSPPLPKAAREIPLYPGAAPGSEKWDWSERSVTNPRGLPMAQDVVRPVLLHYPAEKGKAVGTAMIVAPGGGFRVLMMSYEGVDIARRLNAMGVDAFVLKYRLLYTGPGAPPAAPAGRPAAGERPRRFTVTGAYKAQAGQDLIALAADDGRQAVRLVRERAGDFGVRPDRVGMIGFSAGGVVTSEALFGPAATRPDFAAIIYGVGEIKEVPSPAPPLFLAVAADDALAAARSVDLFTAYRKGKGQAELHVFQTGAHGFVNKGGGADHFVDRLEEWLRVNKLLSKAGAAAPAPGATPAAALKVARDFKAELLYSVPKDRQGSWVNMTVDPKGRLIVSDQNGGLYRITPPPPGGKANDTRVEKLDVPLGGAHGLLYAFDSLYVMGNEGVSLGGVRPRNGLHRARSPDGGDTFEKPELLREIRGSGEHGAHGVVLGPDGQSLYVVCGNDTKPVTPLAGSRVPLLWGEDRLFPIVASDGGVKPPAGCVYKVDPDGKNWELWSVGYRNPFDLAFNRHGELFTYDSDMEWDMSTPWYRPTRVCLVTSGSELGFRDGSNNSPPRYPDTLPAIHDVGPGSPTGMTFGYGARFPARYQEALFLCDWSYGKLYALHLTPDGSAYKGDLEEFLDGAPLPVTDAVVNPKDGALYFVTGGRRTQSGLYRVRYVGKEPTAPSRGDDRGAPARALRHRLEAFHGRQDPGAVETAWPYLGHEDRFVRFAARVAVEHQDPKEWQDRALKETNPAAALNALLALVRAVGQDPVSHPRRAADPVPGVALKAPILEALDRLDWQKLSASQRGDLLRVYTVLFNRLGGPDPATRDRLVRRLGPRFPAEGCELNADLCQLLVYLEAPGVAGKALRLMAAAPTQEEQMDYALSLRVLKAGWTPARRREYFAWYHKAAGYKGGLTFRGTLGRMKQDAVAALTAREKEDLKAVLDEKPAAEPAASKPRPFVRAWKLDELAPRVEAGLKTRRDFDRGRRLFGEARCFGCHRFDNEGGSQAPDLTVVSGRYGVRDILEKVLDPDRAISDQYAATVFNLTDGRVVTGRIVNYFGDTLSVMTNMLDPNSLVSVSARDVESQEKSKVSTMPKGLLDTLTEDEIVDLMAYLLSRGDPRGPMFRGTRSRAPGSGAGTRAVAFGFRPF